MSINQRIIELEKFYKSKGISAFYKKAGIPASTYQSVTTEGRDIRVSNLHKLLDYDDKINPIWLLLGEGEMWKDENNTDDDLREDVKQMKEQLNAITKRLEKEL